MPAPTAPAPLRDQFDSTVAISIPVTTKPISMWSASAGAVANYGAAGTSTYTFNPALAPGTSASRGVIYELLDLLDRAVREGSATVS